jgi:uncharacterized protein (DUF169 family)
MTDWTAVERQVADAIAPRLRPVSVAFRPTAPPGVKKFSGQRPSGCSFWPLAAEGDAFYTVPADHANCPIGSYTHNIAPPPARARELEETLGVMTQLGYVRMEEVPAIPRLAEPPGVVIYAPLGETPVEPDVVLVAGRPGRLMLLHEAAARAGVTAHASLMGRPTCMALPAALGGGIAMSLGCIGNRVYTGLEDDELYVVFNGRDVVRVVEALATIVQANATLADYHAQRRTTLTTS